MATTTERVYDIKINGADSVNDLKSAIEQLTEKLKTLNQTSKEYKDTLQEITKYQEQLTEAMNGLGESFDSANTFVQEFTQGLIEGMAEAAESSGLLDDALIKDAESTGELRDQIKGLQDKLVTLDSSTDEYKKTLDVLVTKNQKLQEVMAATKNTVTAAEGSYNALTQELSALRKAWKSTADEAERARIGEKMNDINIRLKEMDATVGNFQRNVGNYTNSLTNVFGNPKKEIRELREQLAHLTVGSKEYNDVLLKMADLTQQQKHFTDQLRFSSSNLEDIFGNMAGVARGVAGGFSAINAAIGLMGDSNSDLQKAMLKTQQMMALVQGLSGLQGLGDRIRGLVDGIKGFISRMGMVNQSTKEFGEQTKVAATEAERATGSLDAQAGITEKLASLQDKLTESERESINTLQQEIDERKARLAVLKEEYAILIKEANEKPWNEITGQGKQDARVREQILNEIELLEAQIGIREDAIETIKRETIARAENLSETEKEILAINDKIDALNKEIESEKEELASLESLVDGEKMEYESLTELASGYEELDEAQKDWIENRQGSIDAGEAEIEQRKETIALMEQEMAQLKKEQSAKEQAYATQQKLTAQMQSYQKWQILSIAQTKLQIVEQNLLNKAQVAAAAGNKKLAASYNTVAVAARVASVAVKGVKAALISSGIGILLVAISSALSGVMDSLGGLWDRITGAAKAKAEIEALDQKTKELQRDLEACQKVWAAFGATDFKKKERELGKMTEIVQAAYNAYSKAAEEATDNIEDMEKAWHDAQDAMSESIQDGTTMIDQLIQKIEIANQQRGMTQLEKDIEKTNKEFEDAIALVKKFGEMGVYSAGMVEAKINSLNRALALQIEMLEENEKKSNTQRPDTSERDEAERLYKETLEYYKSEEQKLKEKYKKEKALLDKYHKDTTNLTRKYYDDLDKLLTERNKISYDKWKAHLDSILGLVTKNTEEYYKQEIENLEKIFSVDFGAEWTNPFESFFDIQKLDEFGSIAIAITDDIRESMKEMGLDPNDIDDIQTMIDKWNTDKKAIEDAKEALAKFISQQKMLKAETENTKIETEVDKILEDIELKYTELESKSSDIIKGFYSGLSPDEVRLELEERYAALEEEVNKEIELWQQAAQDEKLTAEDKATAIAKYNDAVRKKEQLAVKKNIENNNLLIASYQRVTNALTSMASSISSILGSVSDAILSNANAQREAGKISEEEYEKQFKTAKAFQIAQATINTIAGAVAAFMGITADTGGWGIAAAAIEAAAVLAAGFAQIAQIRATNPDTGGGSGGGGGGSNTFTLPSVMVDEPTYQQNLTNQSDIDALANALGGKMGDQRVVLVESDVTIAQDRAKKVQMETSF